MTVFRYLVLFLFICNGPLSTHAQGKFSDRIPDDLANNKSFVKYFLNLKELVKNDDKEALYGLLLNEKNTFHLVLEKKNSKMFELTPILINNKKLFYKFYPLMFNRRMKNAIATHGINDLYRMPTGLMFHRGQIWWHYNKKDNKFFVHSISNYDMIFP